ncbi:MAG: MFS transporter [Methanosarcinaceae archaeon]|nr:MFS transporter [Methanosarcinaceae archaeon]MDD4496548.1 MFS transporter [Methanosarcinaceae archaeon]
MGINLKQMDRVLKYRWTVFIILALAYFFVYFHRVSTAVVASDIMSTFGVGAASVGLLGSAYFYAYTAMQLPSGILTDSWGVKKTAAVFTMVAAAGAILSGIATSFNMILVGRLLIGTGVAMVYIPVMKVLAIWFKKNEFASMSGVLLAIGNIGALSAAAPLAIAAAMLGDWQRVFLLLGVFSVLLAVAIWMLVKDSPEDMGCPSIAEIEAFEARVEYIPPKSIEKIPMGAALKQTFGAGMKFWPISIWFFFMYGSLMVYQGLWAGPFFRDVLGWDKASYAGILSFIAIGMIFGCPIAGYLSDKVLKSRKKVLLMGTAIYIVLWGVIWSQAGNISSAMAYTTIHFLFGFFGGFFVVSYAQVKEWFPASIVGTAVGAYNIFPFLGGAIFMTLTGKMMNVADGATATVGQYKSVWLLMLVCMILAFLSLLVSKEKGQEEAYPTPSENPEPSTTASSSKD